VREALIKLAAPGAVDAEPGQSFRVPIVTRAEFLEISKIRRAVEGLAAAEATPRIADEQITSLAEIERQFLDAKTKGNVAEALHYNRQFRFTLYEAAGMPNLLIIIEGLWLRIGPCFNYLYPQPPIGTQGHHNYDDVVAALQKRDASAVRAAVERAIDQGGQILLPHLPNDGLDQSSATTTRTFALP